MGPSGTKHWSSRVPPASPSLHFPSSTNPQVYVLQMWTLFDLSPSTWLYSQRAVFQTGKVVQYSD